MSAPGEAGEAGPLATVRTALEGELGRRLVHASGATLPLAYLAGLLSYAHLRALLVVGVLVAAILEVLRLRGGLQWWIYEHLTREYEQEKVAGYALYVVSMAVVTAVFEPQVAIPAMLMLAIADPVGGVLGGEDPIPVKRPRALAGTFLVCLAIGVAFLPPAVAAVAAAAATVADGVFWQVRGYVIDDNLALPLAAAVAAWAGLAVLPL